MTKIQVPLKKDGNSLSFGNLPFADIISPCIHKGAVAHSSYFIKKESNKSSSFRVELKDMENLCKPAFDSAKKELSMSPDDFPYGLTESQWWEYALSPHSYLALGNDTYQVGLNYFNRFLHLNTKRSEAHLVDPGVQDEFLSTTNWFDAASAELWFASWNAYETLRRNFNPLDHVRVTVWKLSLHDEHLTKIWEGELGDSLHQLTISPDKKFLIVAELGLRTKKAAPDKSIAPSQALILDLKTMNEWRIELPAAAHVEFDPNDPAVCYLSGHNIGLIGPKVGIFGPGMIQKVCLTQSGPKLLESFSHPSFYRITTHVVFNQQAKTLIAVSGYPAQIFLIDAATMKLEKIFEMDTEDIVDASQKPHLCQQDSYGITASIDGKYLFVSTTGVIKIADLTSGNFIINEKVEDDGCFTGHVAQMRRA